MTWTHDEIDDLDIDFDDPAVQRAYAVHGTLLGRVAIKCEYCQGRDARRTRTGFLCRPCEGEHEARAERIRNRRWAQIVRVYVDSGEWT